MASKNGIDITGERFGRLVAIKKIGNADSHGSLWLCKCDCGNEKEVRLNYLRTGGTTSCGCLRREMKSEQMKRSAEWNLKHGMCRRGKVSKLHGQWNAMKQRCKNPNVRMYPIYGGRGIRYCEEWEQFQPFMEWALSHGYKEGLALDRIDSDGNYCPENCRWVTQSENNRNKKNLLKVTYNGETKLLVDWARETGQKYRTLRWRYQNGWSAEEIINGR